MLRTKNDLKGKVFNCTRISKLSSVEDIPEMREHYQTQIDLIDGAEMTETETGFEFNNGQFVLKPHMKREIEGKLDCTKTFILFQHPGGVLRIEYKDIRVEPLEIDTTAAIYRITL